MRFSIQFLFAATLFCASVFGLYAFLPTLTLSILLLLPSPILGALMMTGKMRGKWKVAAIIAPPSVILFYVGLIGPLTAFVIMPQNWGFVQARPSVVAAVNAAYPPELLDSCGDSFSHATSKYQLGWASLVIPRDESFESLGADFE